MHDMIMNINYITIKLRVLFRTVVIRPVVLVMKAVMPSPPPTLSRKMDPQNFWPTSFTQPVISNIQLTLKHH